MPNRAFAQAVGEWVAESEKRTVAVLKTAVQEVVKNAQRPVAQGGRMPVKEGNLRNSLVVTINGSKVGGGGDSYVSAIPMMKAGDLLFVGWTAEYSRRMEYGFNGADSLGRVYSFTGYGFLRGAVELWPRIVRDTAQSFERTFRN